MGVIDTTLVQTGSLVVSTGESASGDGARVGSAQRQLDARDIVGVRPHVSGSATP